MSTGLAAANAVPHMGLQRRRANKLLAAEAEIREQQQALASHGQGRRASGSDGSNRTTIAAAPATQILRNAGVRGSLSMQRRCACCQRRRRCDAVGQAIDHKRKARATALQLSAFSLPPRCDTC